jgi:hypothetical protein
VQAVVQAQVEPPQGWAEPDPIQTWAEPPQTWAEQIGVWAALLVAEPPQARTELPVAGPPQALAATTVFARLIHRRT